MIEAETWGKAETGQATVEDWLAATKQMSISAHIPDDSSAGYAASPLEDGERPAAASG